MTEIVLAVPAPLSLPQQAETDAQLLELWFHGKSDHTQLAYRKDALRFFYFVGKPLQQVILRDVQQYVDSLNGAVASKRRTIACLKSLFSFGLKLGYLRFSVAAAVRAPKAMDTLAERILPEAKIHQMIALTPEGRDRMLLRLLYATGARVSTICAVKWRHVQINGESGQITLYGKGGKTHAVVLPGPLWNDLLAYRGIADEIRQSFLPGSIVDTWTLHRFCGLYERRRKEQGSREMSRRIGSGTHTLHMRWIVVPELI